MELRGRKRLLWCNASVKRLAALGFTTRPNKLIKVMRGTRPLGRTVSPLK